MWVTAGSLLTAVGLVAMETCVIRRTASTAIAANRANYLTDIAANAAVLAALGVVRLTGWNWADPTFALAISGYMLFNAGRITHGALSQLLDRELPRAERQRIKEVALACAGVHGLHDLRTRYAGDRTFVEFHLEVDGSMSVARGHQIDDAAEAAVRALVGGTVEVMAHLEPAGIEDDRLDARVRAPTAQGVSSIEPNCRGGEMDCGQKVAGGLVIAGRDGTKLPEPGEEVLDQVSRFVGLFVVVSGGSSGSPGVGSRRFCQPRQRFEDARIRVVSLVSDQHVGGHHGQKVVGAHQIMSLSAGQEEAERIAEGIDEGVDLGAQSASGSADGLVLADFFWRRRYAGGRAQPCCRSSRIHCRRRWRDAERPAPTRRT